MTMLSLVERQLGNWPAALHDRFRAVLLRCRGARLGKRVRIGSRLVIARPWCLNVGALSQFEHQVYIKATTDTARICLGRQVFVGFNSELDISESLDIGDGVLIAPGCFITDHIHRHAAHHSIASQGCESHPVRIESDVWLGAHVVVLPGVTIGRGAIVGAGAVVTRNIAPMDIVAGVPARVIGARDSDMR